MGLCPSFQILGSGPGGTFLGLFGFGHIFGPVKTFKSDVPHYVFQKLIQLLHASHSDNVHFLLILPLDGAQVKEY